MRLGLEAVKAPQAEALTIESLCHACGRTKGSFYHHFKGMEDFLEAVLDEWERAFTNRLIEQTASEPASVRRLSALDALAASLDRDIEQGVRRLASRGPAFAARIARVDAKRIAFLESVYVGLLHNKREAVAMARLEYAAFLGFQQLDPKIVGQDPSKLYAQYLKLVRASGR
ncbi:MAG: TetR/AcrR family transcriptional regulator [Anaerolineales bacterium]